MRRSILVSVFVLALVLAGCSGLIPSGDGTPTATVSPAAIPTDQPTPTPVAQLAPGLTSQGVTDAFALAQAHAAVLDNTSYRLRENLSVTYPNGTIETGSTTDARLGANESRYYVNQSGTGDDGPRSVYSTWSNGERIITARTINGSTSYDVPRDASGQPVSSNEVDVASFGITPTNRDQVYTLLSSVETRIAGRTTRNETTLYRVVATNVTNDGAFETMGRNPKNISFEALVGPRGVVYEYHLRYTATLTGERFQSTGGETVDVNRTVRYTDVGNTTIERPPWYDEATKNVSIAAPTTAG